MSTKSLKVLISGASGFVGRNLIKRFDPVQFEISTIGRENSDYSWSTLHKANLTGKSIIHLAGKAHDLKNASNVEEYFNANTTLTKNIFDLFLESNSKDFIYFSSVKAVADSLHGSLSENTPASPITPYGLSKLKAEEYLLSAKLPPSKRLFIIRPCMIHGPGNKGNLNLLHKVVKYYIPYPLGAFDNRRSFLSIDNLAFAIQRIIEDSEFPSGIYNLADDESLSTNEVVSIMARTMGRTPRIWNIDKTIISSLARVGDLLHLPLNTERLHKLTEDYVVSNLKIKEALKIDQFPVSAREGLAMTVNSFNL